MCYRNHKEALEKYEQALQLNRRLLALDQERPKWRYDLAIALHKVARCHAATREFESAASLNEETLAILEGLRIRFPDQTDYSLTWALAMAQLGELHSALGERSRSLQAFQLALERLDALAAASPNVAEFTRPIPSLREKIAALTLEQPAP